jgi:molybdopterin converting factor small subunit
MFGCLHTLRKERSLESTVEITLPPEGRRAEDIALDLGLPLDKIEGVFVNHLVCDLDKIVKPGDKVAFIPTGIPGPHRFMLGIHSAGKKSSS